MSLIQGVRVQPVIAERGLSSGFCHWSRGALCHCSEGAQSLIQGVCGCSTPLLRGGLVCAFCHLSRGFAGALCQRLVQGHWGWSLSLPRGTPSISEQCQGAPPGSMTEFTRQASLENDRLHPQPHWTKCAPPTPTEEWHRAPLDQSQNPPDDRMRAPSPFDQ